MRARFNCGLAQRRRDDPPRALSARGLGRVEILIVVGTLIVRRLPGAQHPSLADASQHLQLCRTSGRVTLSALVLHEPLTLVNCFPAELLDGASH